MTTIGERVRAARESLELSQTGAATEAGLSKGQWANYERDVALPSAKALMVLINRGVSCEWLLCGIGSMQMRGEDEMLTIVEETARSLVVYLREGGVVMAPEQFAATLVAACRIWMRTPDMKTRITEMGTLLRIAQHH